MKVSRLRNVILLSALLLPAAALARGHSSYSYMPMMGYGSWGNSYAYGVSSSVYDVPMMGAGFWSGGRGMRYSYGMPYRCGPRADAGASFSVALTPGQEVPPMDTDGFGQGTFLIKSDGIVYDIRVQNLSSGITGAHFHLGERGVAGPVLHPITFSGDRAQGTWNLTQEQRTELQSGRIYVNVHTSSYPDGEIRGQLQPFMMGWGW